MPERRLPPAPRQLRVLGVDDAPFERRRGAVVPLCGVVCRGTRMEGMLWGRTRKDGWGATDALLGMLEGSRARAQLHLVLLDGVAVGGLNLFDLPRLHAELGLPVLAVMRRRPDLAAMRRVIRELPRPARRLALLEAAGEIHEAPPFVFQAHGLAPAEATEVLARLTDTGHVPEALRLAHLIGRAVVLGESKGGV